MAGAAFFVVGCDHPHIVRNAAGDVFEQRDTAGVYAVVIDDQNAVLSRLGIHSAKYSFHPAAIMVQMEIRRQCQRNTDRVLLPPDRVDAPVGF